MDPKGKGESINADPGECENAENHGKNRSFWGNRTTSPLSGIDRPSGVCNRFLTGAARSVPIPSVTPISNNVRS